MNELVATVAGIAAILGFVYILVFGQRNIIDWRQRKATRRRHALDQHRPRHNLPPPTYTKHVGRSREFASVVEDLNDARNTWIACIEGPPGIGKTALASFIVWHEAGRPPDRPGHPPRFQQIVWVSARQTELRATGLSRASELSPLTLDEVLVAIAAISGREDIRLAPPLAGRELARTLLASESTLLVVDGLDAINDDSVLTFLRTVPPPSRVLATARTHVDDTQAYRLDALDDAEAHELARELCSTKKVTLSDDQRTRLVRATAGLPVAITWIISRISVGFDAALAIQQLEHPGSIRDVAYYCYDQVLQAIKGEAPLHILKAAAYFGGSCHRRMLRLASPKLKADEFESGILQLNQSSLIRLHSDGWVSLVPLARQFTIAAHRDSWDEPEIQKEVVRAATAWVSELGNSKGTLDERDIEPSLAAIQICTDNGWTDDRLDIVVYLSRSLYERGMYERMMLVWGRPIDIVSGATGSDRRAFAAAAFAESGALYAYLRNGYGEMAYEFLSSSLSDVEGRPREQLDGILLNRSAILAQRLGIIARDTRVGGSLDQAMDYLERAYTLAIAMRDLPIDPEVQRRREAEALNGRGSVRLLNGELDGALSDFVRALALFTGLHDLSNMSSVNRHLSETSRRRYEVGAAKSYAEAAIRQAESADRKDRLAAAYREKGHVQESLGKAARAREMYQRAKRLFREIGAVNEAEAVDATMDRMT